MNYSVIEKRVKDQGLDGLIGETHYKALKSLMKGDKSKSEIFEDVKGVYPNAPQQVVRAVDQLSRIGCVEEAGTKKTSYAEFGGKGGVEVCYKINENGKILLDELSKKLK